MCLDTLCTESNAHAVPKATQMLQHCMRARPQQTSLGSGQDFSKSEKMVKAKRLQQSVADAMAVVVAKGSAAGIMKPATSEARRLQVRPRVNYCPRHERGWAKGAPAVN